MDNDDEHRTEVMPGLDEGLFKLAALLIPAVFNLHIDALDLSKLMPGDVAFRSGSADVVNWRLQAITNLVLSPKAATALMFGTDPKAVPRCVKLNNYWCIKTGQWDGELGTDSDGHVGFRSASAGGRAAVLLLRRYYVEFGRRSAIQIVSHWAPSRCLGGSAPERIAPIRPGSSRTSAPRIDWSAMNPEQRAWTATRLIAARQQAAERRHPSLTRLSEDTKQADKHLMPARRLASFETRAFTCAGEALRIANYAHAAIRGIVPTPDEDLELFDADGHSTWRLTRLLENMAAVEIGPQKVRTDLVTAVVERADAILQRAEGVDDTGHTSRD